MTSPSEPVPGAAAHAQPAARGTLLGALRDALAGRPIDYTRGSMTRAITLLAVPMVLEMAMESTFAIVDVYFVSRLGSAAVAAVGLTESMITIVFAIAIGLSMSVTAMVARRIGEQDEEGAATAAAQAIALGAVLTLVLGVPLAFFGGDLLRLMTPDAEVVAVGSGYTSIMLGAHGVILFLFLNNAIFRGAGDATLAMYSLAIANGVNIVLDPCLIFGLGPFPELGVTGAGIATVCGRGTGVLFQFWALRRGVGRVRLRRRFLRVEPAAMLRLVRLSLGGIGQFLIATASWIVLARIVASFGAAASAGYAIALRIVIVAILPAFGVSNATATLVGQNLGAKHPDRAERSVWLTGVYTMALLALVTVVFLIWADGLIGFFSDAPDVVEYGVQALRIISYGYVFYAWGMVLVQAFNGAGDTWTPTKINLGCYWAFQIPLALALAHTLGLGASGVFWSVCIAEAVMAVIALLVFRRGQWKTRVV
jgi:putative MATE family efflux protein